MATKRRKNPSGSDRAPIAPMGALKRNSKPQPFLTQRKKRSHRGHKDRFNHGWNGYSRIRKPVPNPCRSVPSVVKVLLRDLRPASLRLCAKECGSGSELRIYDIFLRLFVPLSSAPSPRRRRGLRRLGENGHEEAQKILWLRPSPHRAYRRT